MTNGDKLRTLNNQQLAEYIDFIACPPVGSLSDLGYDLCHRLSCTTCWLEWLNSENTETKEDRDDK